MKISVVLVVLGRLVCVTIVISVCRPGQVNIQRPFLQLLISMPICVDFSSQRSIIFDIFRYVGSLVCASNKRYAKKPLKRGYHAQTASSRTYTSPHFFHFAIFRFPDPRRSCTSQTNSYCVQYINLFKQVFDDYTIFYRIPQNQIP